MFVFCLFLFLDLYFGQSDRQRIFLVLARLSDFIFSEKSLVKKEKYYKFAKSIARISVEETADSSSLTDVEIITVQVFITLKSLVVILLRQ